MVGLGSTWIGVSFLTNPSPFWFISIVKSFGCEKHSRILGRKDLEVTLPQQSGCDYLNYNVATFSLTRKVVWECKINRLSHLFAGTIKKWLNYCYCCLQKLRLKILTKQAVTKTTNTKVVFTWSRFIGYAWVFIIIKSITNFIIFMYFILPYDNFVF